MVLDFKQADDAKLLHRILAETDVLIQNLAPGALSRAGFDLDELRKQYAKLITCDISGYGHGKETAGLKAYDFLVQAESGLVSISGGENELGRIGISLCDIGAGMTAHAGILEALLKRDRTGVGSAVAVSLFGVAADWMTVPLLHRDYGGQAPTRAGLHHPSIAPYGGYLTKEGEIVIIAIQNEREWQRFCEGVLQLPERSEDEAFCNNRQRVINRPALDEMINGVTQTLDRIALVERLQNADIAFGSVNSVEDFSKHPALRRREGRSSNGSLVSYPVRPVGTTNAEMGAPEIGQHSDSIREEFAK